MTVAAAPRKKRVFIASSQQDVTKFKAAMQHLNLDAVMLEQFAPPGTAWIENLHNCVEDADVVIGIVGDRRKDANVLFELGVASALNKPALLFIAPDVPTDFVPPSGVPYLRVDLRNEDAVLFGLKQVLSLSPRSRVRPASDGFTTRPIGALADELIRKLREAGPREFEDVIFEAIKASGDLTVARGSETEDRGVDFAIWSRDLEPAISNPLVIECKSRLSSQSDVNEAIGRMFRALEAIPNGFGIVLYKEAEAPPKAAPRSLPVVFLSAEQFLGGLRETGLAEYVRTLRNSVVHGH